MLCGRAAVCSVTLPPCFSHHCTATVARVARDNNINCEQLRAWLRLYFCPVVSGPPLRCSAPCLCLLFVYHQTSTWPPGPRQDAGWWPHTALYLGPTCHPAQDTQAHVGHVIVDSGEGRQRRADLSPTTNCAKF